MVVYIRPRGNPIIFHLISPSPFRRHHTYRATPGSRVLRLSKRPEPAKNRLSLSYSLVLLARTIELRSVSPGVRSDTRHRQLARQIGGVSLIKASSMAITFKNKITLRPGAMFCFGTISCIADEEGTLHRIVDPPEKKPSSGIPREARERLRIAPPPAAQGKMIPCGPRFRSPREKKDRSVEVSLT
jgi:hypothetical protein